MEYNKNGEVDRYYNLDEILRLNLPEELKENSSDYSSQDWEEANEQYQLLVEQIDQYEYTDEELKEIGKIKARCLKRMTKGAMKQLQDGIHSITKQMEGAIEECGIDSDADLLQYSGFPSFSAATLCGKA